MSIKVDNIMIILIVVPDSLSTFPLRYKNRLEMMICIFDSHSKKITLF